MLGELQFPYSQDLLRYEETKTAKQSKVFDVMREWECHRAATEWWVVLHFVRLWKPSVLASIY